MRSRTLRVGTLALVAASTVSGAFFMSGDVEAGDRLMVAASSRLRGGKGGGGGTGGGGTPAAYDLSAANVVVGASRPRSDTGGNDLAYSRSLFRSAGFPESNGGLESSWSYMNDLGMKFSRVINSEGGSVLDTSGNFTPANRLLWNLQWVQRYNLSAHVIVGQWRPDYMPAPASSWDAARWAAYREYAYRVVRYVAVEFQSLGFPEAVFEVGNEVDITQNPADLWTLANPSVSQGDDTRYQHYMTVYRVWAGAVARVAAENPNRSVKIAGPAMGGQSLFLSNTFWHERFVRDVSSEGLRLDILSMHFYGDILNGWQNVPGSSLRQLATRMRSALSAYGRGSTPLGITEYGPSEASDATWGRINATHEGAAWAATFVSEALAGGATLGSVLLVRDNFGGSTTGTATVPSLDYIRDGIDYPKAIHNAFQTYTMLPGSRVSVTTPSGQPNIRAVASTDGSTTGLLVYNYNYRYAYPTEYRDLTVNENVRPGFSGMPANGNVVVQRYVIDANTSNVSKYLDANQAPNLTASKLTQVELCYSKVLSNTLLLPARTLGPSAVSLWVVKPYGGTVDSTQTCR